MYTQNLDSKGLYTFPNDLSQVPVGAQLVADNIVINRDGIAETRRGFAQTGDSLALSTNSYINNIFPYQNRLLLSDGDNRLSYDSTGLFDWVQYTGTYEPPTGAVKIHGVEANKNFYLSTLTGTFKLDTITATPVLAGAPPALDGTGVLNGSSGFLAPLSQCVYQVVWGYTDVNGNLILGAPSQRILVINTGAVDSANVDLTFTIPQAITTTYFYQIYRTPQTTYSATPGSNVPPGAELQLAAQQTVTSGQISAGTVTYTDLTTDGLLGAFLYTDPSQEGATQENSRPPLCVDLCAFGQMMFYANVQTLYNTQFNLISVGSPNGIQVNDTLVINGITFTGKVAQNNASKQFKVDTSSTVAQNIDSTARNIVACINANAATTFVYAYYTSGYNDLPGSITLQAVSFSQGIFYVTSSRGGAFQPVLPASGTTFAATNDALPNGIYISKVSQPEAVPLVNLIFVGGGDQPIYRVLPLRDRVIVIKSDGIFTLTGSTPATMQVTLLDNTIIMNAPESARLLNNSVYCMTNQAVVAINESGVTVKSRAIEGDLLQLTAPQYLNFRTATHAISYESERSYMLCTVSSTDDATATQIFVYNWITNAWTRWVLSPTAGLVNPYDNKLYLGVQPNHNYIYQERKSYTLSDFVDDVIDVNITASTGNIITLNTVSTSWIGAQLAQGDSESFITAVNPGNHTVIIEDDDLTWTVDDALVNISIPISVMWCPISCNYAHYVKNFTKVLYWFTGENFTNLQAGFVTDLSGYTESITLQLLANVAWEEFSWEDAIWEGNTSYAQPIATLVPRNKALGHWIQPSLTSAEPYTNIISLGITLTYDVVSDFFR